MINFVIGIDGGGTGTRVCVADRSGTLLAQGLAGPSALGQGLESAWEQIILAIRSAFAAYSLPVPQWSQCVVAAGLSGTGHQAWRDGFLALNPGFAELQLESDAYTALLGAHAGKPGVMLTAGTGSIGEALYEDGTRREVGGWGFPVGDEGSGAWLGLRAMAHTQAAEDGRVTGGPLAALVRGHCGGSAASLLEWCADARQFKYAQLALLVFNAAEADPAAAALLDAAALELERMAQVLDPGAKMPVAVCGSVGKALLPRLSLELQRRCVAPDQDATHGALILALNCLEMRP